MTLNGQNALYCRTDVSLGDHCTNLNEDRQQQKCRPMTVVSGNLKCMRIFAILTGASNEFFGDLSGYFFGIFRGKASYIIWPAILSADN